MRRRRPIPGELLIHPVAIAATVLLVVNDHWLKHSWPGVITGKLSDFAGLIVFPLLLASLAELLRLVLGREILEARDQILWPAVCGIGFVFVKVVEAGNDAYAWTVGTVRWPAQALHALLYGDLAPQIHAIAVARDVTDLVALVVLPLPYIVIRSQRNHSLKQLTQVSGNQATGACSIVKET